MVAGFSVSAIAGRVLWVITVRMAATARARGGDRGARTPVTTSEDARKHLDKFFEGKDVTMATITEQEMFFKADITDKEGKLVDRVIIHKHSGRIRSIF